MWIVFILATAFFFFGAIIEKNKWGSLWKNRFKINIGIKKRTSEEISLSELIDTV